MGRLTVGQARRVALAAQGFGRGRPAAKATRRHLLRMVQDTHLLQIDSVNVLMRAHYLPGWSRLGDYDRTLLDRMTFNDRVLIEYWGHEASLVPVEMHPLFRWRMKRAEENFETWRPIARLAKERPDYITHVLDSVRANGPMTSGELAAEETRIKEDWGWNWSAAKMALEFLFWSGYVTTRERRNFERVYDLTERVVPADVLALPTPTEDEAHRQLLVLAARACGVGTASDLADYFRIRTPLARPRIAELVDAGLLEEVQVGDWRNPAYMVPGTPVPRRVEARALLAPFDPLIWSRDRTERLFGFHYRIEIYVPAARRVHGYYVLPFLLGDRLVGRVDLKSDRQAAALRVQAAYAEPDAPAAAANALADELTGMAHWLGLDDVVVVGPGDLAPALTRALRSART